MDRLVAEKHNIDKWGHPEYMEYRSGFIVGSASSLSLYPTYPTDFIVSFRSCVDPTFKDSVSIFSDWYMVGRDMLSSVNAFQKEIGK
ncbi:MAG: hypothetical protein ACOY3D_03900 [Candidatus Omnitrophota bacterium]